MKLSLENALLLMALVDDEIEGEAKLRAERLVDSDAHARELVAQMRDPRIRAWLAQSVESHAARGSADAIAGSVLSRLTGQPRRSRSASRTGAVALVAALAMAAATLLYVAASRSPIAGRATVATRIDSSSNAGGGGVELGEIDSPSHDVSVFEISGATAQLAANSTTSSSVVIWIDDEPGAQ